MGIPDLGIKK